VNINITTVVGIKQVIANMKRKTARFHRGIELGLARGALFGLRESKLQVPVEFGPLKASGEVRQTGKGFSAVSSILYTAAYAGYVHEKVEMKWKGLPRGNPFGKPNKKGKVEQYGHKGLYWDPQGRAKAKFLEDPVYDNKDKIGAIVKDTVFRYVFLDGPFL